MAEFSKVEKNEISLMSLYETCLGVLSREFGLIKKKYVKDLPKHILEEILYRLSPYHLEMLENKEFLSQRGIETDSLWKDHFKRRFKHGTRSWKDYLNSNFKNGTSLFNDFISSGWRAQYFKRHFHLLLSYTAVNSKRNAEIANSCLKDDLNKELFRQPNGSTFSTASSLDMDDMLHLCIKHLTGSLRLPFNATCLYLASHENILTKLSSVLEHVEVDQLRDCSVEALSHILDVLLNNKLKSFSLSNCKVENEEKLRVLLKTLAKSQLLSSHEKCPLTQCKLSDEDDFTNVNDARKCNERADFTKHDIGVKSEVKFDENLEKHCETLKAVDSEDFCSSTFKSSLSDIKGIVNDSLYNDLGVHIKEGNTVSCTEESYDNFSRVCKGDQEKCSDIRDVRTEDDLYDDIFARHGELQDVCSQESNPASTSTLESSPEMIQNRWWKERKLKSCYNPIHPHCLTELKLSSCLNDNSSLKVFSEELVYFLNLRSLSLCDIGLCFFPAMNDLAMTIKELVVRGSLRYLNFENNSFWSLQFPQINMFYNMLIVSCERCQLTDSHKGLWSLRLVGRFDFNMDKLGAILKTCSFCEDRVSAERSDAGIWFKIKDKSFYCTPKCLKKGVLESRNSSEPSKNVECNLEELPVVCNKDDSDVQTNSFQSNLVRKTDTASSKHQYICTGIESLYLSFLGVKHGCATVFANSLLRNRSLRSISLPSCGMTTEDISNIFNCISGNDLHEVNTAIEKLDLGGNVFQVDENNSLCNLLTRSHLVYLDLSYCGLEVIPDDVVLALCSNKFLQVFLIAGNRLGDAGVIQLSKVFTSSKKTSVLNTFDLSCNRLSSSSLLHFANVLTTWPTKLCAISVCNNPCVESTIARECLEKVFNDVLIENSIDSTMMYADYISEM